MTAYSPLFRIPSPMEMCVWRVSSTFLPRGQKREKLYRHEFQRDVTRKALLFPSRMVRTLSQRLSLQRNNYPTSIWRHRLNAWYPGDKVSVFSECYSFQFSRAMWVTLSSQFRKYRDVEARNTGIFQYFKQKKRNSSLKLVRRATHSRVKLPNKYKQTSSAALISWNQFVLHQRSSIVRCVFARWNSRLGFSFLPLETRSERERKRSGGRSGTQDETTMRSVALTSPRVQWRDFELPRSYVTRL